MWFTAACPSWLTGCDKGTRWNTQPAGENPGAAPTRRRGRRGRRGPLRCGRGTIQNKPENAARVRQLRERWRLERPVGGAARLGSDRGLAPEAERATPGGGGGGGAGAGRTECGTRGPRHQSALKGKAAPTRCPAEGPRARSAAGNKPVAGRQMPRDPT